MTAPRLPDGYHLVELGEVVSSNDEAKRLAEAGAPDGTLVWALSQTAGRGRRGRQWLSEPGNLFLSLVVRPDCPPYQAVQLTFVAALAVRDMLCGFLGDDAPIACKWPNDVLVDGRKISGILLESATVGSGNIEWLVLGVGVNLRGYPIVAAKHPATALIDEGAGEVLPAAALERFAEAFSRRRAAWRDGGFDAVRDSWLEHAYGIGRAAEVRLESGIHSGVFTGIDEGGALCLRGRDGTERHFSAGDVTFSGGA
jgi:BirA family biotin operon repressor/biotin-[acetyl-CoA-carboxylase] ligase